MATGNGSGYDVSNRDFCIDSLNNKVAALEKRIKEAEMCIDTLRGRLGAIHDGYSAMLKFNESNAERIKKLEDRANLDDKIEHKLWSSADIEKRIEALEKLATLSMPVEHCPNCCSNPCVCTKPEKPKEVKAERLYELTDLTNSTHIKVERENSRYRITLEKVEDSDESKKG